MRSRSDCRSPSRSPWRASTVSKAFNILVRIEAEDGTVGWGEAASAPTMTGDTLAGLTAAVRDHLAPLLIGEDAWMRPALREKLRTALYGNTGAHSAVEVALLDLAGQAAERASRRSDRRRGPPRGRADVAARQSDTRAGHCGGAQEGVPKASVSSSSRSAPSRSKPKSPAQLRCAPRLAPRRRSVPTPIAA